MITQDESSNLPESYRLKLLLIFEDKFFYINKILSKGEL